jgi:hypothetical protein
MKNGNEILLIRELLCEMIKVSYYDAIEKKRYKSVYKQAEIDNDRKSASDWFSGAKESPFPFTEVCHALGIPSELIIELINKKNATLSKLDL